MPIRRGLQPAMPPEAAPVQGDRFPGRDFTADTSRTVAGWVIIGFFVPVLTLTALAGVTNCRDAAERAKHHAELMAALKPLPPVQTRTEQPNVSVTGLPLK